ncbi:MAG: 1-deoxy-D-xylulose-5-phosphate reductoisomerase [Clostridiales bacterium]|jgi:1-deoxy-D-xylulose-5-phosphate reductoisomerase|nr:1-deoxy-D-xylulose-5-phosphate reductoisomerase [Clostridiales bacterium]
MGKHGVSILGATGSIGTQTLDVLRNFPRMRVRALTGHSNIKQLSESANEFKPETVCVPDAEARIRLRALLDYDCEIVTGDEGLLYCAAESGAATVVNALTGRVGLEPTFAAIQPGVTLALANKESLVTAGPLVTEAVKKAGAKLTLIDSEHSAIMQCIEGGARKNIEKIILTASGGAFRDWPRERIEKAAAAAALRHPTWNMGKKITLDSATMMNKGLEFIEAVYLYGVRPEQVEVLIHPQSIVHSMVQFADGSVMAQLSTADMRIPIQYALLGNTREPNDFPRLDFTGIGSLTFEKPDARRFPCLRIAREAVSRGGTYPAVMNMLNELAVQAYLEGELGFYDLSALIEKAFDSYTDRGLNSPGDIREAEDWAQEFFRKG